MKTFFASLFLLSIVYAYAQAPWMNEKYQKKQNPGFYDIQQSFYSWWGNKPAERGKGYKPFKRWEYLNTPFAFPDGTLPHPQRFLDAYQKAVELSGDSKRQVQQSNWIPFGVYHWQNGYNGYNPGNGRINFVAVSPDNHQEIYAATASGGIWKSLDGGNTWNTTFDQLGRLGTSCVAINPSNNNIVLVGTGDRDAFDTKAFGILKSTDRGVTWQNGGLNNGFNDNNINKIIFNPQKTSTIFAATNATIYRSYDNGDTWNSVFTGFNVKNLFFNPSDTNIIYGSGDAFCMSTNGGNTFIKREDLPHDTCRVEVAVAPSNGNIVYLLASTQNSTFGGLYRSADAGLTFTLMSNYPNIFGYDAAGNDDAGQAWYDMALTVSPTNENEVFIGGVNIWKSLNGGSSWINLTEWTYNYTGKYAHADIHYLGFYGDSIYCGSDGGIFVAPANGEDWSDLSAGIGNTQFYAFGNSQINGSLVIAGAQDNGSNVFKNGTWTHIFGADGFEAISDYTDQNIMYFSSQSGGIMRSFDGGATVEGINNTGYDGGWLTPFVMDPNENNILFMGLQEIYFSGDYGSSWGQVTNGESNGSYYDEMTMSPNNSNYIYASSGKRFIYSHDAGGMWNSILPSSSFYITGITVSDDNPKKVWISMTSSTGDKVMHSKDGGASWTNYTDNANGLGLNCILHQPDANDGIYIGTETGVFFRDSTMNSWVPFDIGLPKVKVTELEISGPAKKLRAATYGRGIWESPAYHPVGIQSVEEVKAQLFPLPAHQWLNIEFPNNEFTPDYILIFNASGMLVKEIKNPGNKITLDVSKFSDGFYFMRSNEKNEKIYLSKFLIMH